MAVSRSQEALCENCEMECLEWCDEAGDGDGDGAYICPNWRNFPAGSGCFRAFTVGEYAQRLLHCKGLVNDSYKKEEEDGEEEEEEDTGEEEEDSENKNRDSVKVVLTNEDRKAENIAALLRGDLVVRRQALLPKVLSVSEAAAVVRRPFKSPCPGTNVDTTRELLRRLNARKRFVPWGSGRPSLIPITNLLCNVIQPPPKEDAQEDIVEELPPGIEPLVLWQPNDDDGKDAPIIVDPSLVKYLRPHQREGVQFMFECVAGLRDFSTDSNLAGCILADDMGLGKTLQSITLLWTLLKQGLDGSPMAKRVLIVTPTSLVSNWEAEIQKWLGGRANVIALCESSRSDVLSGIATFLAPASKYQVMIISYETFRMHSKNFHMEGSCDLLICDEAHRLKNDQTLTNKALAGLHCRRRVLLSGTPMQNDLEEFYAMVNFTNPGVLGDATQFRRYFELPIIAGREPNATDEERVKGAERSSELSENVNRFILRRTNALLSNHLPPKIVQVVCCRLTELQEKLYKHFIHSKNVRQALEDKAKQSRVLSSITALKKLCNHPKLIYDTMRSGGSEAAGFGSCLELFPAEVFSGRHGSWTGADGFWVNLSGKMSVLAGLLAHLRRKTDDRIVLVSNYTQTLDLFAQLCRERNYPFVRLDGTTSISKRQKLVQRFNDPKQNEFAFLLSSKAGGCGLNLIGGNRLVLFDPDWNPANDKQAAARVWRDGQKKRVFIYRFLTTGTIEEKVFERQISKEGLQKVVEQKQSDDVKSQVNWLSSEDLRDLFTLQEGIRSDIHENLCCKRCPPLDPPTEMDNVIATTRGDGEGEEGSSFSSDSDNKEQAGLENHSSDIGDFAKVAGCLGWQRDYEKQVGTPLEEDLMNWAHHANVMSVPDAILQAAAGNEISFVFSCQIDGKLIPIESLRSEQSSITATASSRDKVAGRGNNGERVTSNARHGLSSLTARPTITTTSTNTERGSSLTMDKHRVLDQRGLKHFGLMKPRMDSNSSSFHRPSLVDAGEKAAVCIKRPRSSVNLHHVEISDDSTDDDDDDDFM